jgi:hypothetical protein
MIGREENDDGERYSRRDVGGGGDGGKCPAGRAADDSGQPSLRVTDRLTGGDVSLRQIELNTTSVGGAGHATIVNRLHRSVVHWFLTSD